MQAVFKKNLQVKPDCVFEKMCNVHVEDCHSRWKDPRYASPSFPPLATVSSPKSLHPSIHLGFLFIYFFKAVFWICLHLHFPRRSTVSPWELGCCGGSALISICFCSCRTSKVGGLRPKNAFFFWEAFLFPRRRCCIAVRTRTEDLFAFWRRWKKFYSN